MSDRYVYLSYPITESMPLFGLTPAPKVLKFSSIKSGDSANSSIISLHTHTGTHIDFPRHFFDSGKSLSDYNIESFIYSRPVLVSIPKSAGELVVEDDLRRFFDKLKKADLVLIKTGFSKFRRQSLYKTHNPGIDSGAIRYIRTNFRKIKAVGIDSISISSYQFRSEGRLAHKEAFRSGQHLGEPLLLIEDMNLSGKFGKNLRRVFVFPLPIPGLDACPCAAMVEF